MSWVCGEGCVDRVGSYDESLDESCQGVRPRHPLREVPVVGACEMRRSQGGVSLWDEASDGGAIEVRGVGYPL